MQNAILDKMSKNELRLHDYLNEVSNTGTQPICESLSSIAAKSDLSVATIHRSLNKLKKNNIVKVITSEDRALPNSIIYYGILNNTKIEDEICDISNDFYSHIQRFNEIFKQQNLKIKELQKELSEKDIKLSESNKIISKFKDIFVNNTNFNNDKTAKDIISNPKLEIVAHVDLEDGSEALVFKAKE